MKLVKIAPVLIILAAALAMVAGTGRPELKITGAWVRPTPPGAPTAAVYALIENAAAEADRLVAVETDAAESAELHSMAMEGGMMVMRRVEGGLAVPPHGTLQLHPGGYHIMLIHPRESIREGQQVRVTLVFQQAGRLTLSIKAGQPGSLGAMGGAHGMGAGQGQGQPMGQGAGMPHGGAAGAGHGMGGSGHGMGGGMQPGGSK